MILFTQGIPHFLARIHLWMLAAALLQIFCNDSFVLAYPGFRREDSGVVPARKNEYGLTIRRNFKRGDETSMLSLKSKSHTFDMKRDLQVNSATKFHKLYTRDLAQTISESMQVLKKDEAVFPSDSKYSTQAMAYAKKHHKVFYVKAWTKEFIEEIENLPPGDIADGNVLVMVIFAFNSIGKFFVVGKPGSPGSKDNESKIVYGSILPVLKANPRATALVIVDPKTFSEKTVWTAPKSSIDSQWEVADEDILRDLDNQDG